MRRMMRLNPDREIEDDHELGQRIRLKEMTGQEGPHAEPPGGKHAGQQHQIRYFVLARQP